MLFDIVFRPSSVEERGWVLIFNTILATASSQDPALSDFSFHLRWNAWLAADEASICTEASTINMQALLVFAGHGQDLVTPTLCWNLMGQACRMAQLLRIYTPSRTVPKESDAHVRNLCLFWSLFNVDKSLSLCFGCPPVLPMPLYRDVELPSSQQLASYRPHLKREDLDNDMPSFVKFFGAFFFVQITKLSMIEGEISDYCLLGSENRDRHLELIHKLDQWISVISQVRY